MASRRGDRGADGRGAVSTTLARALATPMPRRRAVRLVGAIARRALRSRACGRGRSARRRVAGPPGVDTLRVRTYGPASRSHLARSLASTAARLPRGTAVCGHADKWLRVQEGLPGDERSSFRASRFPTSTAATNVRLLQVAGSSGTPATHGDRAASSNARRAQRVPQHLLSRKGTYCCGPKQHRASAATRRRGAAADVGAQGKPEMMCCTEPSQCATQTDRTGTAPRGARQVCCPEDRVVPFGGQPTRAASPGYLSLGRQARSAGRWRGRVAVAGATRLCGSGKCVVRCFLDRRSRDGARRS